MVAESISSSLSAAPVQADPIVATNITANSQDAPLEASSFASVLSMSLMSTAIAGMETRTETATSGASRLNLQEPMKGCGGVAGELPERIARLSVAGMGTVLSGKKPMNRPEDIPLSAGKGLAGSVTVALDANAPVQPTLHAAADFSGILNSGRNGDAIPPPETSSQPPLAQPTQILGESVGADSSLVIPTLPTEPTVLASSAIGMATAVSATAPTANQLSLPMDGEPEAVREKPERLVAGQMVLSQAAPRNSLEAATAITASIDSRTLPSHPFVQATAVAAPVERSGPKETSGANTSSPPSAVSVNTSSTVVPMSAGEPFRLVIAEPSVVPVQSEVGFAGRADQSEAAPLTPSESATATAGNVEASALPVYALQQDTSAASRPESWFSVQDFEAPAPAPTVPTTMPNPDDPDLQVSVEPEALGVQPENRSKEFDLSGLDPAIPLEAAAATTGSIEATDLPARSFKPDARVDALLEAPAQPVPHPNLNAAGRVPPPLISREATSARTNPDGVASSDIRDARAIRAPNISWTGSSNESLDHKPSRSESNAATASSPAPESSSVVRKSTDIQPLQATDAASGPELADPSVEAAPALQSPVDASFPNETSVSISTSASASAENSTSAALLDATGTSAPDPNLDNASPNSADTSRNDAGKNQASHASSSAADRSAADRSAADSSGSTLDTVTAAPLKIGPPLAAASSPATAGTADPAVGNASSNGSEPILKGHPNDTANGSHPSAEPPSTQIPSAQIAAQIAKSDVKIAIHGGEFGSVELHAKMAGEELSASITVEHHEAHTILSGDLPALHQALNDRQLRVSEILLLHNSLSSGGSSDDGPNAQRDETSPRQSGGSGLASIAGEEAPLFESAPNGRSDTIRIFDSRGRLSVRA